MDLINLNNDCLSQRQKHKLVKIKDLKDRNRIRNKKGLHFGHFSKATKTIKIRRKINIFDSIIKWRR